LSPRRGDRRISGQSGKRVLNVSMGADALDVQYIGRRLGSVWDRVGVGIIVVDRRSSDRLCAVPNQNGNIDVVDNIHRNLARNRSSDWNIDIDLNSILHDPRYSNRNGDRHLHLHGTLNLVSNHNVVRPWNRDRDWVGNANS